ncbi:MULTISPECIES: DNA-binding protein [Rhodopirellula]|uniref:DNA-binding protein n=1 Tax=Rhodopirellula TaxID=265488 RepID=UPI00257CA78A|nr:DNA-binding protein [Rhodopirellula sp. UBA1907]
MSSPVNLLSSADAAQRLGISVLTLYDWLTQSDVGEFQLRGQQVTIDYLQGGRRGQGRIRIPEKEVQRLLDLMRVKPKAPRSTRSKPTKRSHQHITATLGRPDD